MLTNSRKILSIRCRNLGNNASTLALLQKGGRGVDCLATLDALSR